MKRPTHFYLNTHATPAKKEAGIGVGEKVVAVNQCRFCDHESKSYFAICPKCTKCQYCSKKSKKKYNCQCGNHLSKEHQAKVK